MRRREHVVRRWKRERRQVYPDLSRLLCRDVFDRGSAVANSIVCQQAPGIVIVTSVSTLPSSPLPTVFHRPHPLLSAALSVLCKSPVLS